MNAAPLRLSGLGWELNLSQVTVIRLLHYEAQQLGSSHSGSQRGGGWERVGEGTETTQYTVTVVTLSRYERRKYIF